MDNIVFRPFKQQRNFLLDNHRIKGAFAGKRGGKTEVGAISSIMVHETKAGWIDNKIDPYLGVIVAPTYDMLKRLSWRKFLAYARPFITRNIRSPLEITWRDNSVVYGISADNPKRLEGIKANWIWLDEIFHMDEQTFLECRARVADSKGMLICSGSLGIDYINPKLHWAYKYFKEIPDENTSCHEWSTADNPYFPVEELESLKNALDPETFRSMFTINWDVIPKNAVYADFSDINISQVQYDKNLPTFVSIDWGWAHKMAVMFFQYDIRTDRVYLIDEIVRSRTTLEELTQMIMVKNYNIKEWICDIAGNQEREQTGISNVNWFKNNYGVKFKFRSSGIIKGISLVRSYIKNTKGQARFFISDKCKFAIDSIKRYSYIEKNGIIQNELPQKKDDDEVDAIRYFFVNILDKENVIPRARVSYYA